MKSITATRLSPTNRYILLSFGLRNDRNEVNDHPNSNKVCCEIYSTSHLNSIQSFRSMQIYEHPNDTVNVALFHPSPGFGFVFGTQKPKIHGFIRK